MADSQTAQIQDASPEKPALGAPHDGWAAFLLTVSATAFFFGHGSLPVLSEDRSTGYWILFLLNTVLFGGAVIGSIHYWMRSHGATRLTGAAMPMMALTAALMAVLMWVLPHLRDSLNSHVGYALACLAIATLAVAPLQSVISHDPQKHSELT
ncbi:MULTISPECIES: hypothetical protein [Actinomycetes]|uniref:Uncharacterized protein n=2 Tax=Actinomycetes TaxID=1760 RepID=A0ABP6M167_9MICC|nr:hypothetical protein [Nesterenkonia sp. PF2B19]OSM43069.1 hypothetical protein BCY76_010550 [Nesterenkonia sp. PF2B19]